ncbi:MAG TPA: isoprenylcysteine carboxylmethyltransferase family protein [Candidatus Dormibacteraeota bacterium]|nr:isoprenylcysteine carboxylmethyltransferase family protein [Candidatus Dormibacteraeota bacterium]
MGMAGATGNGTGLPSLGRRGEGWFAVQVALMAAVALAGLLGPAWDGAARAVSTVLGGILVVLGGGLGVRALVDLRSSFTPLPRPVEGGELVQSGIYRLVRHPMYLAVVTGALGWSLLTASIPALAASLVLFAFFDLKSRREETWLVEAYPGYERYRQRTRRIVPGLY